MDNYFGSYILVKIALLLLVILPTLVVCKFTKEKDNTRIYYSIAPFIGAFLVFVFLGEALSAQYVVALLVMIVGTLFIVYDTLVRSHTHEHSHTFTHIHNGVAHAHTITHTHKHNHISNDDTHEHHHRIEELEKYAVYEEIRK